MAVFTHAQAELDALARRLAERGYRCRSTRYFAHVEVLALSPGAEGPAGTPVAERSVFLCHGDDGWMARVTPHGGPHWVRRVSNCSELEAIALQALATDARPRSDEWVRDESR